MSSVTVHPPKTPVTSGSNGIAKATLPNVCKMPGPPAPFVPTPLPNIGKSGLSPQGYSTTVEIEGNAVAIRGATFASMGDIASKATGGGLLSANTHGISKIITPGSLTVKIEGKAVHLLGEPALNNCGPSGTPPNTGATMMGMAQEKGEDVTVKCENCKKDTKPKAENKDRKASQDKAQRDIDESKAELDKRTKELASASKALADRAAKITKGKPSTDTLRRAVPLAEKRVSAQRADLAAKEKALEALKFEEKVANECGGGDNMRLVCTECGSEVGDLDVVTKDGRVKECKSSAGGFRPAQFQKYKALVEGGLLGPGNIMKVAVPGAAARAELAAANPEIADRIQDH